METGRPSVFSEELAKAILERVADGESLRSVCRDDSMPGKTTVFRWLADNQIFRDQYALAKEMSAEGMADEILDIADDGSNDWMEKRDGEGNSIGWKENGESIRRSALRVDARKWVASRLLPKKYGDKIGVGAADGLDPIQTESPADRDVAKAVAFILAKGINANS